MTDTKTPAPNELNRFFIHWERGELFAHHTGDVCLFAEADAYRDAAVAAASSEWAANAGHWRGKSCDLENQLSAQAEQIAALAAALDREIEKDRLLKMSGNVSRQAVEAALVLRGQVKEKDAQIAAVTKSLDATEAALEREQYTTARQDTTIAELREENRVLRSSHRSKRIKVEELRAQVVAHEITALKLIDELDLLSDDWAQKVNLPAMIAQMLSTTDAADRFDTLVKLAWVEGAYTGRTSRSTVEELSPVTPTAELRAQVEALRVDAERYRWLRNPAINNDAIWPAISDSTGAAFDKAIDAARASMGGEAGAK